MAQLCTAIAPMRLTAANGNLRMYEYWLADTLAWDAWCIAHFRNGNPEPAGMPTTNPGPPTTLLLPLPP